MKSIKRIICLILTVLMIMCCVTPVMASRNIKVKLGGELIKFDVKPQIINDRTMVPLRAIFEALGAKIEWNGETQTVTATKKDTTISLAIDDATMFVNGEAVTLDSPARLVDGRTLVPVRAISEAFDLKVEWNGNTSTVIIKKPVSLLSETSFGEKYFYDENGNLTFEEKKEYGSESESSVSWTKYTYDENSNLVYSENSFGKWEKYEYDENAYLTYKEASTGQWVRYTYDENGNKIHVENANKNQEQYTYDELGNMVYKEDSWGFWEKHEYDEKGNEIYYENSNGEWIKYTYDENDNMVKEESTGGDITTYVYDENGNCTSFLWTSVFVSVGGEREYDENGNLIYKKDSIGEWEKYEYDENGNLIYSETESGKWKKYIVVEK